MNFLKQIIRILVSEKSYNKIAAFYMKIVLWFIGLSFNTKRVISIPTGGFKIVIDPANGFTDKMLFKARYRDKDITDILDIYLKKGSTFIDVGMNIGYETLWAAQRVGSLGKVYSFEPLPKLIEQVKESIDINKYSNIRIIPKALGTEEGNVDIFLHSQDSGLSSLVYKGESKKKEVILRGIMDVELKDVSNVDLIKIDVEGYEFEVLTGATKTLQKFSPPVVFEFTPHMYETLETGRSLKILNFFFNLGYSLSVLSQTHQEEITLGNMDVFVKSCLEKETALNLLAVKTFKQVETQ